MTEVQLEDHFVYSRALQLAQLALRWPRNPDLVHIVIIIIIQRNGSIEGICTGHHYSTVSMTIEIECAC